MPDRIRAGCPGQLHRAPVPVRVQVPMRRDRLAGLTSGVLAVDLDAVQDDLIGLPGPGRIDPHHDRDPGLGFQCDEPA